MLEHLIYVNTWFPKYEVDLAEQTHYAVFSQKGNVATSCGQHVKQEQVEAAKTTQQASLSEQIRDVRKIITNTAAPVAISPTTMDMNPDERLVKIEKTHQNILQMLDDLKRRVEQLETNKQIISAKPAEPKKPAADDDDVDLFGSDDEEESEETKKRLAAYAAKKSTKVQIIAKSSILLDIKPWDDETDLTAMEKSVRSIETDGLIWGQAKFVPVAFGVKKLQINCVVEDDKVGTDFLEEKICEFEDYVQSVDIVSFNKI